MWIEITTNRKESVMLNLNKIATISPKVENTIWFCDEQSHTWEAIYKTNKDAILEYERLKGLLTKLP